MITFSIVVGAPTLIYNFCTSCLDGVAEAPGVRVPDKAGAMFKSQKPVIKHCTENLIRLVLVCTQDRCVCTVRSLTTSNPALTRSPNGVWTEYNGPDDPFLSVSGAPGRFGRITLFQAFKPNQKPSSRPMKQQRTLANTTWKSNSDFLHEVRQIPEITKVIPEAELVELCSVEQHCNHIDETFGLMEAA